MPGRSCVPDCSSRSGSGCDATARSPRHGLSCARRATPSTPWGTGRGERARQELRAAGESSELLAAIPEELTAQELQIAQMAAEGLSNREIGERLFLSHRTVESHLYRVFPKLGVTSRGQLTEALISTWAPSQTALLSDSTEDQPPASATSQ